ncbi:hypothetical protein LguiA_035894 [Lonicera macranthoides]
MARRLPERGSHLSLQHLPPTPVMAVRESRSGERTSLSEGSCTSSTKFIF